MYSKGTCIVLLFITIVSTSTLIASTEAKVFHNYPRAGLKKRQAVAPLPLEKPFIPIFSLEQQQYLLAHNTLRASVGVPPLRWSRTLTELAHAWAEERKADCDYRHHSTNHFGENIFWMSYKEFVPADVVQSWFSESKWYDHERNECMCFPEKEGCECGHYLAVVWNTTRQIGCSGAVYCDDQKGVFVVCNYDPPGLTKGINPLTGDQIDS